jgi:hypothetical protein
MYRINLDEVTIGLNHPTYRYMTPKLDLPAGVNRSKLGTNNGLPIPSTITLSYNVESTTGDLYAIILISSHLLVVIYL